MSLVPSLLQAIVGLDGEACVIHVGEKPYVVAPTGQVDLATRGLTFEAVNGILEQLLPIETQNALDEFGAIQYELPPRPDLPNEHFTVVVARGGDDVWVEIRRRRTPDADAVPPEAFLTPSALPAHDPESMRRDHEALSMPDSADLWPARDADEGPEEIPLEAPPVHEIHLPASLEIDQPPRPSLYAVPRPEPQPEAPPHVARLPPVAQVGRAGQGKSPLAENLERASVCAVPTDEIYEKYLQKAILEINELADEIARTAGGARVPVLGSGHPLADVFLLKRAPQPAVVLPLSRSPVRSDTPSPLVSSTSGLDRLLRIAAARGASTLYLASQARPSIRVDGEIQMLDEAALGPSDVESLLIDLMPERNREALRSGVSTEWICDVSEVGRVRCMTFRDHRGAGGIFRMMPVRAISADQLGLSREIQALAAEPEGLVLVAGPRSSGKDTLISAFVDLINRTRRDHVITIESEIKVVHENRSSLVSQREVRGNNEETLAVVRGAIRENPDVLVIDDLRTADMITVALDAANSGHLIIGALPAHTATGAIDRIIDFYPPEDRRHVQLALAENLRGVVAQVLLRRPGGGRLAAREVLLNTSAVASVIAEGKTSQLPLAMESGRKHGMVPLNDALVGIVQSGAVEAREAYRRAADRTGFLALLKRQGVDTSFAERLA